MSLYFAGQPPSSKETGEESNRMAPSIDTLEPDLTFVSDAEAIMGMVTNRITTATNTHERRRQ
jgi:hypothetical protein